MAITSSTPLQTAYGEFKVNYHRSQYGECTTFSLGAVSKEVPIVRIHSACLFGEAFGSLHCDCSHQLEASLKRMKDAGCGVVVYSLAGEGMGLGLEKKIESMEIQRKDQCDFVEALHKMGFKSDQRTYQSEVAALKDLSLNKHIKLFSNNPTKKELLENAGFIIDECLAIDHADLHQLAQQEQKTKEQKLGYK